MKEKRIEYIVDKFVDENGDERNFVIAAISYDLKDDYIAATDFEDCVENCEEPTFMHYFSKGLKVGYSFCRPKYTDENGVVHEDKFNEKLGIEIAIGRARKNAFFAQLVLEEEDINSDSVKVFLERRAKYFKNNPASRIAGFKRK